MAGDAPKALGDLLDRVAADLGIALSAGQRDALLHYVALLEKWNVTYNLTSVRDPGQMMVHHLADSMAVVPPLMRHAGTTAPRVLDAGSGAGLPGMVLAIVCPQWSIACVDAVGKKTAFVRHAAAELKLSNVEAVHARLEILAPAGADVVISRAFASLPDMVTATRRHVVSGGVWAAMKGKVPTEEIAGLPSDVEAFHVERLSVPMLDAERCLVWLRARTPL